MPARLEDGRAVLPPKKQKAQASVLRTAANHARAVSVRQQRKVDAWSDPHGAKDTRSTAQRGADNFHHGVHAPAPQREMAAPSGRRVAQQKADRQISNDVRRVYTRGDSIRLKDKTDAQSRLRRSGIYTDPARLSQMVRQAIRDTPQVKPASPSSSGRTQRDARPFGGGDFAPRLSGATKVERSVVQSSLESKLGPLGKFVAPTVSALLEDPVKTGGNTLKSLPGIAKGSIGGIVEATEHPIRTAERLPGALAKDYSRRYGGDTNAQIERIKREGAAPEITDAVGLFGGTGAVGGRALGALAKTGKLGKDAERLMTTARPLLRVREGDAGTIAQDASPNIATRTVQQMRDERRKVVEQKRTAKGAPTMVSGEGEVVRRVRALQGRGMTGSVAARLGRGHVLTRSHQDREIRKGILKERADARKPLNRREAKLFNALESPALHGLVDFTGPDKLHKLDAYAQMIADHRTANPGVKVLEQSDALKVIQGIHDARAHPDVDEGKVLAQLHEFAATQADRARRMEAGSQVRASATAEARRFAPEALVMDPQYRKEIADIEAMPAKAREDRDALKAERDSRARGVERAKASEARAQGVVDQAPTQANVDRLTRRKNARLAAERNLAEADDTLKSHRTPTKDDQQAARRQADTRMVKRSRARLGDNPEPAYVLHRPWRKEGHGDFAAGGTKPMAGDRHNEFKLFQRGTLDLSPSAYEHGTARSIKREVQWNTHTDIIEGHALKNPKTGEHTFADRHDAERFLEDTKGHENAKNYRLVNIALLRRKAQQDVAAAGEAGDHLIDHSVEGDKTIRDTLNEAVKTPEGSDRHLPQPTHTLTGEEARFGGARQWAIVHKKVADELTAQATPSGATGRAIGKVQSLTSRAILNTNPLYVPQNTISNAGASVVSGAQSPLGLARLGAVSGNRFYRKLPEGSKHTINEWAGIHSSAFASHRSERMGSTLDNKFVQGYHAFVDSDRAQAAARSHLNPFTWNAKGDEIQNNVFRKEVFYDQMRRRARDQIKVDVNGQMREIGTLSDILKMPDNHPDKLAALKAAEPTLEKLAQHTDNVLGNWTKFTANERKVLKRSILFYGFMRYATKLTFYTMPIKHPIVTAIIAKIGELHNDEIAELLGDQFFKQYKDQAKPYTHEQIERAVRAEMLNDIGARIFTQHKDGTLSSFDAAKVNPFVGPAMDVLASPFKGSAGLISPVLMNSINALAGKDLVYGTPLNLGGKVSDFQGTNESGSPLRRAASVVRSTATASPAIRAAEEALTPKGALQSDDSIPLLASALGKGRVKAQSPHDQWVIDRSQRDRRGSAGGRALATTVTSPYKKTNDKIMQRLETVAHQRELKRDADTVRAMPHHGVMNILGQPTYTRPAQRLVGRDGRNTQLNASHKAIQNLPTTKEIASLPKTEREQVLDKIRKLQGADIAAQQREKIRKILQRQAALRIARRNP